MFGVHGRCRARPGHLSLRDTCPRTASSSYVPSWNSRSQRGPLDLHEHGRHPLRPSESGDHALYAEDCGSAVRARDIRPCLLRTRSIKLLKELNRPKDRLCECGQPWRDCTSQAIGAISSPRGGWCRWLRREPDRHCSRPRYLQGRHDQSLREQQHLATEAHGSRKYSRCHSESVTDRDIPIYGCSGNLQLQ